MSAKINLAWLVQVCGPIKYWWYLLCMFGNEASLSNQGLRSNTFGQYHDI